jgi:hypothetical protein
MTTATLAHNLSVRRAALLDAKLVTSVGWIGNAAHEAECSDHNPDSRGKVHAIDAMTLIVANQKAIVEWTLSDTADLEYVINQRTIWTRSNGWKPSRYTGTDPHTNHVHISGRHGSVGFVAHKTCTGYNIAAEAMTPEGFDVLTSADKVWIQQQITSALATAKSNTDAVVKANFGATQFTDVPDPANPGQTKYSQSIRGKLDSIEDYAKTAANK